MGSGVFLEAQSTLGEPFADSTFRRQYVLDAYINGVETFLSSEFGIGAPITVSYDPNKPQRVSEVRLRPKGPSAICW